MIISFQLRFASGTWLCAHYRLDEVIVNVNEIGYLRSSNNAGSLVIKNEPGENGEPKNGVGTGGKGSQRSNRA